MAVSHPRATDQLYAQAKKIDDLAFQVVAKSLPTDLAPIISKRILYDYIADIGAIGILRKLYLENFDLDRICRLYWGSRREIGNPNFESILAQLLINIAASFIYDRIKELYEAGLMTEQWMSLRGIATSAAFLTPSEFLQVFEHSRLMHSLYRLKQISPGTEAASKIVNDALAKDLPLQKSFGDPADTQQFEVIVENMRVIARGVVVDSIRDTGHKIPIPTGGLILEGLPASPGIAWGTPIVVTEQAITEPAGDVVIVMDSSQLDPETVLAAMSLGTAVITGDGMTGHVPVVARGIGRPCVGLLQWRKQNLSNFSFAVVDGYAGFVRLFVERPVGYPALGRKRAFYKHEGD